jgi:uncharacterized protein (TIGR02217 family)
MQIFSDYRFPTDVSYGMLSSTYFDTEVIETHTGHEYRNIRNPFGRNKYTLVGGIRTNEQTQQLINFFRAVRGKAIGFRFKDWLDYQATNQDIAIADGKSKKYQLVKTYALIGILESRKITKPVQGTVEIFLNNARTRLFKIDYDIGEITFPRAPKKGIKISANFEFDVPVRFNSDVLSASMENFDVNSFEQLELIELNIL